MMADKVELFPYGCNASRFAIFFSVTSFYCKWYSSHVARCQALQGCVHHLGCDVVELENFLHLLKATCLMSSHICMLVLIPAHNLSKSFASLMYRPNEVCAFVSGINSKSDLLLKFGLEFWLAVPISSFGLWFRILASNLGPISHQICHRFCTHLWLILCQFCISFCC